jgi:N-acetylmuramoyl-L-alanine amidase
MAAGAMRIGIIIALLVAAFGVLSCSTDDAAYAMNQPTIGAVRVGLHQARTRFVVETSTRPHPRVATTAQPSQVVITLPDRHFVPASRPARGTGLIRDIRYQLTKGGKGAQIILATNAPAVVANMFVMDPSGGKPAYRLVIDLVADAPPNGPVLAAVSHPGGRQAAAPSRSSSETQERWIGQIRATLGAPAPASHPGPAGQQGTPEPVLVSSVAPAAKSMHRLMKPEPVAPPVKHRPIVVIDPGHGGVDPGAIGRSGEYEKTVVLAIAHDLKKDLLADGRYKVVMTRDSDVFIPLAKRVKIAREAGASLFLSIHADTISDSTVQGAGVYTLSASASDAQAAALAAKENSSDQIAGIDLSDTSDEISSILIDFAQHHTQERSVRLAQLLVPRIGKAIDMRERSHRSAGFRVLKAPDVPSALVEVGYLSNPADEAVLTSSKGRAGIARALYRGICDYFGADS